MPWSTEIFPIPKSQLIRRTGPGWVAELEATVKALKKETLNAKVLKKEI